MDFEKIETLMQELKCLGYDCKFKDDTMEININLGHGNRNPEGYFDAQHNHEINVNYNVETDQLTIHDTQHQAPVLDSMARSSLALILMLINRHY